MKSRVTVTIATLTLAVVALAVAGSAQTPTTFRAGVHTVEVYVTVRDRDNQLVRGLTREDFELFENGKRRQISVFSNEVQPVSVGIVLDRSGSIAGAMPDVMSAAAAFVRKMLPDDRAALQTLMFDCHDFTSDKSALLNVLRGFMQADMGSPVWAGLDRALSALTRERGRRAMLIFSDGIDMGSQAHRHPDPMLPREPGMCQPRSAVSRASPGDVAQRAVREDVLVYSVGVDVPSLSGPKMDDALRRIAHDSGGLFLRLKPGDDLTSAFARIADELHHQYLIGFVPESFDGKVHRIDVRSPRRGLELRARRTFIADRAGRSPGDVKEPPVLIAPLPRLTDAEVERAIADGRAGKRLQVTCTANGAFPDRPEERDVMTDVVFEGPVGRIMRMARDAARMQAPFDAASVRETDRAPTVMVTAAFRTSTTADPFGQPTGDPTATPSPTPSPRSSATTPARMTNLRLWGDGPNPPTVAPLDLQWLLPSGSASGPSLGLSAPPMIQRLLPIASRRLAMTFDLAAFRALPGPRVEVMVYSFVGERSCHISASDKAAIR